MIDFETLKALRIPEGEVIQIAKDGAVLWNATIKFIMNGETYTADRNMTWAEWFASSYNTTGKTEGTVTNADGNEVSLNSVIVGGAAYEFVGMATITIKSTYSSTIASYVNYTINGVTTAWPTYNETVVLNVPIGTVITFHADNGCHCTCDTIKNNNSITCNGKTLASITNAELTYEYTVIGDMSVDGQTKGGYCGNCTSPYKVNTISILET